MRGLHAVAINRNVAPKQRLDNEVQNDPTVVRMHAGTIRIKNASNLDAEPMLPSIIEEQRFGAALPSS